MMISCDFIGHSRHWLRDFINGWEFMRGFWFVCFDGLEDFCYELKREVFWYLD